MHCHMLSQREHKPQRLIISIAQQKQFGQKKQESTKLGRFSLGFGEFGYAACHHPRLPQIWMGKAQRKTFSSVSLSAFTTCLQDSELESTVISLSIYNLHQVSIQFIKNTRITHC